MSTQFSKGPTFGLSADVRNKLVQKYDPQTEEALRLWIQEVTGRVIPDKFMEGLKDGVILCELINKLQPGLVLKINQPALNWHKLENITNFIRAISDYGLKPHDIFEANDLFEDMNHTQVQCTLVTLAGMAKTKGFYTKFDIGVKYTSKKNRKFTPEKLKEGNSIICQQMGSNKYASQKGMTSYGTRRHIYDPKMGVEKPVDRNSIHLQMGTNKCASMSGMAALGTVRQVTEKNMSVEPVDTTTVSLQMGTNKVPSQSGLTPMGGSRLVYDRKYCNQRSEEVAYDGFK